MARPRIFYFDIRGRVEALRLIFEHLGIDYQDDRILNLEEWPRLKLTLPFGELPIYEEGDLRMAQSQAIIRHIARVHKLYGENELERTECDMAEEALVDVRERLWRYQWRPDYKDTKDAFAANELSPRLSALEGWHRARGSEGHWVKGRFTYVDFLAFAFIDELDAFFPETLNAFGSLRALHKLFAQQPRISAYLASDRRPAAFGYGALGLKFDPRLERTRL